MTRNDLPPITLLPDDLSRLDLLTGRLPAYRSAARRMLARELARARVLSSSAPPADLVIMHSTVRYRDDTERIETATIVYPGEEAGAADRVSVVTPVGAALIGLSEGQSIDYLADDGRSGRLTVLNVVSQSQSGGRQ
jgi:regulator of nucleoside diphosphate kinase